MGEGFISIRPARSAADIAASATLFEAYARALPIDLAYQDFSAELASLPGKYAPPSGELLLARAHDQPVGCVAVRSLDGDACEMKRLYVAPEGRGHGLGRLLAEAILETARCLGYREMRLDMLPSMTAAIALYEALGFVRISAYYDTPIADTVFLSRAL